MLSDVPRQQLAAIYVLNSRVADDDKLCEAYLRDYCGENRREIAALAAGASAQVEIPIVGTVSGSTILLTVPPTGLG